MKLDLQFYKGKDEYSDGDIENNILNYIDKYPNELENVLKEDNSWPVVYHLSRIRENVISWYDFKENSSILEIGAGMGAITSVLCDKCKKVTSIELSKRRANAILKRNINRNNLNIIVGNFEDIQFKEKYDYILLNGVLEYAALYIKADDPYVSFLEKMKSLLKKDGHILIAIENRTGLKYWAGAYEDHTGLIFDGIKNYPNSKTIKTFTKEEIEKIVEKLGLKSNFYYMFPDYKFPEVIFSDDSLKKNIYCNYGPYYYRGTRLFFDERKTFDDVYKNNVIPFFANSYFVDINENGNKCDVEFVKYNNYRNKNYLFYTCLKNNKFYKYPLNTNVYNHFNNIVDIYNILSKNNRIVEVKKENNSIYSKLIENDSLSKILDYYYDSRDVDNIINIYQNLYNYLKKHSGKKIDISKEKTIFEKYNIKNVKAKFDYYENGILDFVPNNIYVDKDDYILIDQEWYESNCPIEFVMYRCIISYFCYYKDCDIKKILFKKFNIEDNITLFKKLENNIFNQVNNGGNEYFNSFYTNYVVLDNMNQFFDEYDSYKHKCNELERMINEKENYIRELEKHRKELEDSYNSRVKELNNIYNSKGYKLLQNVYKIEGKVKRKK